MKANIRQSDLSSMPAQIVAFSQDRFSRSHQAANTPMCLLLAAICDSVADTPSGKKFLDHRALPPHSQVMHPLLLRGCHQAHRHAQLVRRTRVYHRMASPEALVGIRDDQFDPGQSSLAQAPQKSQPELLGLRGTKTQAQDLPPSSVTRLSISAASSA